MEAATVPTQGYGALELKRSYQRNLTVGVLLAAFVHLAVLGGVIISQMIQASVESTTTTVNRPPVVISDFAPPPSLMREPRVVRTRPAVAPSTIGIPAPFPDEQVTEDVRFATKQDLIDLAVTELPVTETGLNGAFDSIFVDESEYFPEPGQFVAFQEEPKCIHAEPAVYPEIAQLTGREGSVVVYALVGTDGTVVRTRIAVSAGSNVGFDEAALESVSRYRFRPALQNGQPVAVWVSQRIDFKLD